VIFLQPPVVIIAVVAVDLVRRTPLPDIWSLFAPPLRISPTSRYRCRELLVARPAVGGPESFR